MSKGNVPVAVMLAFAIMASPALADDEDNIGALGRIQTHTLIINAKVKERQAQAELDGKVGADGTPVITRPVNPADEALPNVRMIMNGDGGPSAIFLYSGGVTAAGKVGTKIPGGYTVKSMSVTNRSVEVADSHGKMITLGMSGASPVAPSAAPAAQGYGSGSRGAGVNGQGFMGSPVLGTPMIAR